MNCLFDQVVSLSLVAQCPFEDSDGAFDGCKLDFFRVGLPDDCLEVIFEVVFHQSSCAHYHRDEFYVSESPCSPEIILQILIFVILFPLSSVEAIVVGDCHFDDLCCLFFPVPHDYIRFDGSSFYISAQWDGFIIKDDDFPWDVVRSGSWSCTGFVIIPMLLQMVQ